MSDERNPLVKKREYFDQFLGRKTMTLREVRKILAFSKKFSEECCEAGHAVGSSAKLDIGPVYPGIRLHRRYGAKTSGTIYFPQLRMRNSSVYKDEKGYLKRLDKFISKYGADASFPTGEKDGNYNYSIKPMEADNDAEIESSEETLSSNNEHACPFTEGNDQPSPANCAGVEKGKTDFDELSESPKGFKWELSFGDVKPGASDSEQPNPPQDEVFDENLKSDKGELNNPLGASKQFRKGLANPSDMPRPFKVSEKDSKQSVHINRSSNPSSSPKTSPEKKLSSALHEKTLSRTRYGNAEEGFGSLGDVSSALNNPFSFGTFALSGAKGQRAVGNKSMLTKPATKTDLKSLIESPELADGLSEQFLNKESGSGSFSRECRFRNGNPGGFIDINKATLGKKRVRAEARKIAAHFTGFFIENEVGVGAEETPRINSAKLAKELFGKSMRMGSARKEEKGAGLKLILVDISPSCEAIRDACFAAALAIADQDPDVVVMAHFNGHTDYSGSSIVGIRQEEIPHINGSIIGLFEDFLKKGKVSGAICFVDNDAEEVYSLLSHYCPTVWLSPDTEVHCIQSMKHQDKYNDRVFEKARIYIIGGVVDAKTAVEGLKKLRRK